MKKILMFLVLIPLLFVSCSKSEVTCCYGYFGESAYAFIYSENNNTLYEVRLPLQQILLWGREAGMDSIPMAIRNFVGLEEEGFLIGNFRSLETAREIIEALGEQGSLELDCQSRLNIFISKAEVLSKKNLLDNMKKLCGEDISIIIDLVCEKKPQGVYFDSQSFINSNDLDYSQRYFSQWLGQVLRGSK